MGDNPQEYLTVYCERASGCKGAGEVAFDHREDGFYLPALAVGLLGEAFVQESSITPGEIAGFPVKAFSPSPGRGNDALHVELLPAVNVVGLALITRVGQKRSEAVAQVPLVHRRDELGIIELRAPVDYCREDKMASGGTDGGKLDKPVLQVPLVAVRAARVVNRDAAAL